MAEENKQVTEPDPNSVSNKFVGIPIAELVAAPLVAVCDSQKKLAQSAYEFMTEIGFNDEGKTRMVEFNLQRPIEGSPNPQEIKVQAPFLGLVPLPNLLIDDVQVDFQMEVTATESSAEKSASEGSTSANANFKFGCFGGGSVNVSGSFFFRSIRVVGYPHLEDSRRNSFFNGLKVNSVKVYCGLGIGRPKFFTSHHFHK